MKKRKKTALPESVSGYDYSTREERERTALALFQRAKSARTAVEIEWERFSFVFSCHWCVMEKMEKLNLHCLH